jgi:hypothetical protein
MDQNHLRLRSRAYPRNTRGKWQKIAQEFVLRRIKNCFVFFILLFLFFNTTFFFIISNSFFPLLSLVMASYPPPRPLPPPPLPLPPFRSICRTESSPCLHHWDIMFHEKEEKQRRSSTYSLLSLIK